MFLLLEFERLEPVDIELKLRFDLESEAPERDDEFKLIFKNQPTELRLHFSRSQYSGYLYLIYFIWPLDQYIAEEDLNGAPNRFSFRKLPKTSFFFFFFFFLVSAKKG